MWRYHANRMEARRSHVRSWKSGRVHLAEGSNVVVLQLPYSTEFGQQSRKFAGGVRRYGKYDDGRWQTRRAAGIISIGRRESSSTRQRTGARRMDVHTVSPAHGRRAVATAQAHDMMEVSQGSGVCAALCIRRTLCRQVTIHIDTPMVIFCCLTVFWRLVHCTNRQKHSKPLVYQSSQVYQDCTNSVPTVYQS